MFQRQSLIIFALIFSLFIAAKTATQTTTFTITTTADTVDASPGDGICDIGTSECSLRAAIMEANALDNTATINLPADTFALTNAGTGEDASTSGDLDITADITLTGSASSVSIIDANFIDRAIHILPDASVTIENVTVRNGQGQVQYTYGMGVLNEGTLTVRDSIFTGHLGRNTGGTWIAIGGSIFTYGDLVVERSQFLSNQAVQGAGIAGQGAISISIFDSHFENNYSTGDGSAFFTGVPGTSTVTVERSTFVDNESNDGGAVALRHSDATLTNNTFSDNLARSRGAAAAFFSSDVDFRFNTVVYNTASNGSNVILLSDDLSLGDDYELRLYGNILTPNTTTSYYIGCTGGILSEGYNLYNAPTCNEQDIQITASGIEPLADNGGYTQTHALSFTSPAVNAIPIEACTMSTDQRNITRPQAGRCDIGAYEVDSPFPPIVMNVNTNTDTGDGVLDDYEFTPYSITQILVTLDGSVDNPAGDSDTYDVTNPANYRLIRPGADVTYSTENCTAVGGDDVAVPINSVSFDDSTYLITVSINGGIALPNSRYRFIICPQVSRGGLLFDGNQDNTGGDAFIHHFEVDTNRQLGPTFTVNIYEDSNDGYCSLTHCSLRDAVLAANAEVGANTILLPAGTYPLTIGDIQNAGSSTYTTDDNAALIGDLDVTDELTIIGDGADTTIIDGIDDTFFLFDVRGLIEANIIGVTLTRGYTAIRTFDTTLTLESSYVVDNAQFGLELSGSSSPTKSAYIQNSTIAHNGLGGIVSYSSVAPIITNTTVSSNGTIGGSALGGVYAYNFVSFYNSTIVNNIGGSFGGGIRGNIFIANSVVYGNTAGTYPNCSGWVTSFGYNYFENIQGCLNSSSEYQDSDVIAGTNPILSPLTVNGGTMPVHLPLVDSPLVGAGNPGVPGVDTDACEPFDQNGVARTQYNCDIGAVQASSVPYVQLLSSNIAPYDGSILDNEMLDIPVTQLLIKFSQSMTETGAASVTNPSNYMLVRAGVNGTLQTASCDAISGDDVAVPIDAIRYTALSRTVTLDINGGNILPPDTYRVFACATLQNTQGTGLDGNSDGTPTPDYAATFVLLGAQTGSTLLVTTTMDAFDGICGPLHCTLREAVYASNQLPGKQTIELSNSTYALSIRTVGDAPDAPQSGRLVITDEVTILGTAPAQVYNVIDGNNINDSIFEVTASGNLTVQHINLLNANDSAVRNNGIFVLLDGQIEKAESDTAPALYNTGTATLQDSTIYNNKTTVATNPSAIFNDNGTLVVQGTVIYSNHGGLGSLTNLGDDATVEVRQSHFYANQYNVDGGGAVYNGLNASLTITNTEFAHNRDFLTGSAIYVESGDVILNHTTLVENMDKQSTGVPLYMLGGGTLTISNSIVVNNYTVNFGDIGRVCEGSVVSGGGNVFGNISGCDLGGNTALDSTDFGRLVFHDAPGVSDNYSVSKPAPRNPAIGNGNPIYCEAVDIVGNQRTDGVCDSGSYEESALLTITGVMQGHIALINSGIYEASDDAIQVALSKLAYNPSGDIDTNDVTNPVHYLLVADGVNGTFDSTVCATAQGDDITVTLNSTSYAPIPPAIVLTFNNGMPLPEDSYRLLICDSLYSIGQVALDGDNNGTEGGNFILDFHVVNRQAGPVYTVNTTADENDGECTIIHCSLREAIIAANFSTASDSVVVDIPAGTYNISIGGTDDSESLIGDFNILRPMTVQGKGSAFTIINGNGVSGVFYASGASPIYIRDLTITGGTKPDGGGGLVVTNNFGTTRVIVSDVVIESNTAYTGGGIAVYASHLELYRTILRNNSAEYAGGGIHVDTFSGRTLTIEDSTIENNSAPIGGGLYVSMRTTSSYTIRRSLIADNNATDGAGLYLAQTAPGSILNTTFSNNQATNNGGAIYHAGSNLLTLSWVTITNNVADSDVLNGGIGHGLYRKYDTASVTALRFDHSIIANNGNAGTLQCVDQSLNDSVINTVGFNVLGDMSGCTVTEYMAGDSASDIIGQDPLLLALADNGGYTQTHALQAASPAINLDPASCNTTDQRGVYRPTWGGCDSGAYEYSSVAYNQIPPIVTQTQWVNGVSQAQALNNNDALASAVYGFNMTFSRPMVDFVNSTSALNEIDNPANYRLVASGANGTLETTSCTLQDDDFALPLTTTSSSTLNTVNIATQGNTPLPAGNYRLVACANLTDTYGNALDGNADSTGGDAYSISFSTAYPSLNLVVTSTANTTDGVCDSQCTLREAIAHANSNSSQGTFHIALPAGVYNVSGLSVQANVVVVGAGMDVTVIDGQNQYNIFSSNQAINLTLQDLTLQNARNSAISMSNSLATLTLERVATINNQSVRGGGLFLNGVNAIIRSSLFMNNTGTGTTTTAGGGAIYSVNGTLLIENSVLINNQAIRGSAVYSDNLSTSDAQTHRLINTTITNNTGGSVIFFTSGIILNFVTLANNSHGFEYDAGNGNLSYYLITMNSVVANNGTVNCTVPSSAVVGSYNVIDDHTCEIVGVGNIVGVDAGLLEADGAGPITIFPFSATSPVRDIVPSAQCTVATDLRGNPRPSGSGCDAGSYEEPVAIFPLLSPTNLNVAGRTDAEIYLAWHDRNTNETAYLIERSMDGSNWIEIAVLAADTTTYTDSTAACNTVYHYRVRAYRSYDAVYSTYSSMITTSLLCALNAPDNLTSTNIQPTRLTLIWEDTNVNESGYEIQRSSDNGVNWVTIATTNTNSVEDSTVICGTAYQYRVRAYRSVDSTYSAFTAVITVTSDWCTLTVNSTGDTITCSSQVCTLRGAMYRASQTSNPNPVRINFNIPGSGPHVITVGSSLPSLQHSVIIDGWTQPGFNGTPLIVVDGRGITETFSWGLRVHAPNTVIRGMNVNGFHWGIWVAGYDNYVVEGNWVGIDPTGMFSDVPNSFQDYENSYGIRVDSVTNARIGGTSPQSANRFGSSRNLDLWVIESSNVTIQGNVHGIAVDGVTPIAGRGAGVLFHDTVEVLIGGIHPGEGNIIANRKTVGVEIPSQSSQIEIVGNSIYNINERLGIDLFGSLNVDPNDNGDMDSGGNNLQNYPELTDSYFDENGQLFVTGTLHSMANSTYRIDMYTSDNCNASGYGAGQRYIAGIIVTTDGTGNVSFNQSYALGLSRLEYVTATATSADGNTSEFSACRLAYPTGFVVAPTNLAGTFATDAVDLTWHDGELFETAYFIERSLDDGTTWDGIANLPANSTSYSDSDVIIECERRYDYRVRAYRNIDDAYSDWVTITLTTDICPVPRPPANVSAAGTSRNTITVNWQDDNLSVVTYEIERTAIGTGNWFSIAQFPAGVETFMNGNLLCNRSYDYRIRAFRPVDSLYSPYSPIVTGTTVACPPLDPPVVPPLDPPGRSEVTINLPTIIDTEITTYFIERSVGSSSMAAMSVPTSNWVQIAAVPSYMPEFTDTGLNCNTSYVYRLRGYRAEDNSYSPYSDEMTIITAPCPIPVTNTVGLYRNGLWLFRDANATDGATIQFTFGPREAGWTALTGDWDGDGVDGIGLYRDGLFILRNASEQGAAEYRLRFGPQESGWQPIVGDWNGDGVDTIGVYRNGSFMLSNSNTVGTVDYRFRLGAQEAGWQAIAGDWNASGWDSVGLYRNGYFYLSNNLDGTGLLRSFQFGPAQAGWTALTGDWDADGVISIGLYNSSIWRLRNSNSTGASDIGFNFGANESGWQPIASYRGGATALALMAQSAVDTPLVIPTETIITPTAQTTETTITPFATETPEMTAEVTIELSPTTLPTETALTPEPTIVPTETLVQTETAPIEPEATIPEVSIEQTPEITPENTSD